GTDLGPDLRDGVLDDRDIRPCRPATRRVEQERLEDLHAVLRVHDLGMELHGEETPITVFEPGDGDRVGACGDREAGWRRSDRVAVAHPDDLVDGEVGEQQRRALHVQLGAPVLALPGPGYLPTEIARDELGAVADAEERNPRVVYRGLDPGRPRHVDRPRATRKDDRLRVAGEHLRDRHRTRNDLAVYVDLAYPPGDQLRVLRPEVDAEDEVGRVVHASTYSIRPSRCPARAATPCPRSSTRARPSPPPSGIP